MERVKKYFKNELFFCFIITFVFGFIAYAFAFFNPSTSVDANAFNMVWEREHQYAIGRIFQPLYRRIFGLFHSPFLNGLYWLLFLSLSIFFLAKIFNLERIFILFLSAILTISACFIKTTNYFPQWNGIYSLSLFLSVLSVYLLRKYKLGGVFVCLNTVVLGLYQSYICVTIGLIILLGIKNILDDKSLKTCVFSLVKSAILIILSVLLYLLLYELILKVFCIEKSEGYNSTASVSSLGLKRIVVLVAKSYILFFRNLILFSDYQEVGLFKIVGVQEIFAFLLFITVAILSVYFLIKIIKDKKIQIKETLFIFVLIMCLPLGFAFICVLTNGNGLMNMYLQNLLVYVLPMILYKEYVKTNKVESTYTKKKIIIISAIMVVVELIVLAIIFLKFKNDEILLNFAVQSLGFLIVPIFLFVKYYKNHKIKKYNFKPLWMIFSIVLSVGLIYNSIVYANEQHSKHYLISQQRLSAMTILVDTIESDEDYHGQEIYVYGHSSYLMYSYNEALNSYLVSVLGRGYNFIFVDENEIFTETELLEEIVGDKMKVFPTRDCLKMVGDKLVLKLGEID